MSDYILKFWPVEEVSESKTERIRQQLQTAGIAGMPANGDPTGFRPGASFGQYLEVSPGAGPSYLNNLLIVVSERDYGVEEGEEDFEYIERNNVVSIHGGDGEISGWDRFCGELQKATGDVYKGGWELL